MIPDESYLTTTNLNIGYSKNQDENILFRDLNLSLYGGQMVCFMGPNGIGKSSLLRTLAGLQKPLSGSIEIQNRLEIEHPAKNIAVVLTDRVSSLNLTVEEVVTFGRYPYLGWNIRLNDNDRRIIDKAIRLIQLEPLLQKKLYELSDGQQQMVMIARALTQDTPIILLDEPTAHLDLNNRVEVMNLLLRASRTMNKAILMATHELDLALQKADLIWLTGKDQNILTGLPEDLVLNGSFDGIFQFKGFDLKTGRVQHHPFRQLKIQMHGEGPEYLWTKNALERSGFLVSPNIAEISIIILQEQGILAWIIKKNNNELQADSIANLLKFLQSIDCGKYP